MSPFAAELVALAGVVIRSGIVVVGCSAGPIDSLTVYKPWALAYNHEMLTAMSLLCVMA